LIKGRSQRSEIENEDDWGGPMEGSRQTESIVSV
jgi:hypothetical protein